MTDNSVELTGGIRTTFRYYAETSDLHSHDRVGNDVQHMKSAIDANLARFGTIHRNVLDFTYNHVVHDVISGVMTITFTETTNTFAMNGQFLASMQWYANGHDATPIEPYQSTIFSRLRVIDWDSIQHTTENSAPEQATPNASTNWIGQATSQLNTTTSTDPARNGLPRGAGNLAGAGFESLGQLVGNPIVLALGAVAAGIGVWQLAKRSKTLRKAIKAVHLPAPAPATEAAAAAA